MSLTLDELRYKIVESVIGDWSLMSLNDGPIDLESFTQIRSPEDSEEQRRLERDSLRSRATYRPDIRVGLVWGLADRSDPVMLESAKFVDPRGWTTLLGVLWDGTLVDRYLGVVVDGGRAVLPFPENWRALPGLPGQPYPNGVVTEDQIHNRPWLPGRVTQNQVGIWRTVNVLDGTGSEFDTYLVKSGFRIVPDPR